MDHDISRSIFVLQNKKQTLKRKDIKHGRIITNIKQT